MEFRNLTPFDTLCFSALDPNDDEHQVIVMKVGYRLSRGDDGRWHADVMDSDPTRLCTADEHWGAPGQSSVKQESDLAPFKPRCDVLVQGSAHAPGGLPAVRWETRLKLSTPVSPVHPTEIEPPHPLNPLMGLTADQIADWERAKQRARTDPAPAESQDRVWMDKRLSVLGPHHFERSLLRGWHASKPQPMTQLPLRWEHAFGGRSTVTKAGEDLPLLDEVCFSNPLGCGWLEAREHRALRQARQPRRRRMPAPQIVPISKPLRAPVVACHPDRNVDAREMAEIARGYRHEPVGFGPLGRAWAPRLALAGTYDEAWLEHRHPGLPQDIDFGYWNGAPPDQQVPYLPPGFRLEAWNLTEHAATGGYLCVDLPEHRPFLLLRLQNGVFIPMPMVTDTVHVDTDAMTVSLTHRAWIHAAMPPIRVLEARFEVDPDAPLIKRAPQRVEA